MAKKIDKFEHNPGMGMLLTYAILFAVIYLTISIAANMFPNQIVLGTLGITRSWALIYGATALTLINTFSIPLVKEWETRQHRTLPDKGWMMVYLVINFIGVWCISRYAEQLGVGLTSWKIALYLAIVLNAVQGLVMMPFSKWRATK